MASQATAQDVCLYGVGVDPLRFHGLVDTPPPPPPVHHSYETRSGGCFRVTFVHEYPLTTQLTGNQPPTLGHLSHKPHHAVKDCTHNTTSEVSRRERFSLCLKVLSIDASQFSGAMR